MNKLLNKEIYPNFTKFTKWQVTLPKLKIIHINDNLEKQQVVITGVTGYIGAWVAKAYLDSGKYRG